MKLYLVRHGESFGNYKKLVFGITDYDLTKKGINDAKEVASKLKDVNFEVCYSSNLKRAYNTALYCIKNRNIEIVRSEQLNEQNIGLFENCEYDHLIDKYPKEFGAMMKDWTVYDPIDGESFDDMYKRVESLLEQIIKENKNTLIVTHNGTLTIILLILLKLRKPNAFNFYFRHGTYTTIQVNNDCNKLLEYNK